MLRVPTSRKRPMPQESVKVMCLPSQVRGAIPSVYTRHSCYHAETWDSLSSLVCGYGSYRRTVGSQTMLGLLLLDGPGS
jgi:hypothetical protein